MAHELPCYQSRHCDMSWMQQVRTTLPARQLRVSIHNRLCLTPTRTKKKQQADDWVAKQLESGDVGDKLYDGTLFIFRNAIEKPVKAVVDTLTPSKSGSGDEAGGGEDAGLPPEPSAEQAEPVRQRAEVAAVKAHQHWR